MTTPGTTSIHLTHVYELLVDAYGHPQWIPDNDPLGGLVGTILSQHTSDINSGRAYQQLIATFHTWEEVRDAPLSDIISAIRSAGLAKRLCAKVISIRLESHLRGYTLLLLNPLVKRSQTTFHTASNIKAPRIQDALHTLTERQQEQGDTKSLADFLYSELKKRTLEEAWQYLRSIPGVGPKTTACVLMFDMGMPAMPIDTHVWRVSKRLGLIGPKVSADQAHGVFAKLAPPDWVYTLHVHLIRHGRQVCHAQRPACERCVLYPECAYVGSVNSQETTIIN